VITEYNENLSVYDIRTVLSDNSLRGDRSHWDNRKRGIQKLWIEGQTM